MALKGIKGTSLLSSFSVEVEKFVKSSCKLKSSPMNFLDSVQTLIYSQQFFRLAAFRIDKKRNKVITDNLEIFLSSLTLIAIAVYAAYIGQKVYFSPPENFFQTSHGESSLKYSIKQIIQQMHISVNRQ